MTGCQAEKADSLAISKVAAPTARQGFEITCFSDRHFWHEDYDKAKKHRNYEEQPFERT
jgi:hypothetical protein